MTSVQPPTLWGANFSLRMLSMNLKFLRTNAEGDGGEKSETSTLRDINGGVGIFYIISIFSPSSRTIFKNFGSS